MSQVTSLASFGHDFQTKIFKCVIQDKVYGTSILQMLKQSYFAQQKFKIMLKKIKQYHAAYQAVPNYATVKILINNQRAEEMPQLLDLINRMQQDHPADQLLFVKKQSLGFCRNQQMKEAIIQSVELLNDNNLDGIWQRMHKVMKVTMDGDVGLDMSNDFGFVMLNQNRRPVSTGYKLLNQRFNGGVGRGQLRVIMAPTGGGKSQFLINIRRGALVQGKVVVYYSMQLGQKVIAARMAALVSGVKINSIQQKKDQVIADIKYFYEKTNSKLIIKQFPTKSVGPSAIRAHIHKLRAQGINPNMIIVDYADLLKPTRYFKQKRTQLEQLYESLRQIAGVQGVPIWTATQTNRMALQNQIIQGDKISQSFAKMFVADQVISIARTTNDKIAGTGKLHVVKNRNGQQGQTFSMTIATDRCLFIIDRKLDAQQCGQDSNRILDDFKKDRQKKITNKLQDELRQFKQKNLNKDKEK